MKSKLKLCLSALRGRGTKERLTLKNQPKLSLKKPLSRSLSNEASATRSLGSSKICSSGPPSTVPSLSLPKNIHLKRCLLTSQQGRDFTDTWMGSLLDGGARQILLSMHVLRRRELAITSCPYLYFF